MIKRLLAWLGTFLGIVVGLTMILAALSDDAGASAWARFGQGAIGCFLVWVLGGALLRSLRRRVRRT
ncbi:hypothetical protein [Actinocorallia libanotica]|uniref:Secreted protein with PEP-CTERM sorting signal n=1 Tax=Actinocorallia libanotica TaxID=46162 RepID=A0ABN1RVI4_9ACTN